MGDRTTTKAYSLRRSGIHNQGLFAKRDIKKGEYIIQYKGEKITKKESERRAIEIEKRGRKNGTGRVFIFELNSRYDIDGSHRGNTARYINHSCEPNCESIQDGQEIWVQATRDIAEGEELTYDYGYAYDNFRDHPCLCGKDSCIGYIVIRSQRWRVRRALEKEQREKNLLN